MSRELKAFGRQKWSAADRGIEFKFSFEQWVAWWESALGPDWMDKRGRTKGKFHMARRGDIGPYSAENVIPLSCSKNSSDGAHHFGSANGAAKLRPEQVKEARSIYIPGSKEFGVTALARKYGVLHGTIGPILRGQTWRDPKLGWTGGAPKRISVVT